MIAISEATAKLCIQALGEIPLKFSLQPYSELIAALQAAPAQAAAPEPPAQPAV